MVVSAADVGVDDQVIWLALDGEVVDAQVFFRFVLKGEARASHCLPERAIRDHAPGAVIQLYGTTPRSIEVADNLAIRCGDVRDKLVELWVHPRGLDPVVLTEQLG